MAKQKKHLFDNTDMQHLESSLEDLLRLCETLQQENKGLRKDKIRLTSERTALIKKNEMSRRKMEGIVMRLKSMELEI